MKQIIIQQKDKQKKQKFKKLLESRWTYMVIAVFLIFIGIFSYVSTQRQKVEEQMTVTKDFEPKEVLPNTASVAETDWQDITLSENAGPDEVLLAEEKEPQFIKPIDVQISVPFSKDNLIYSKTMEDWRTHMGIDLPGDIGTPVKAAAGGIIEQVKQDEMLGSVVIIKHNDHLKTIYCNLQSEVLVKEGEKVDTGTVIGGIGNTAIYEIADPPHLHFEVEYKGEKVNPEDYISFSE